MLRIFLLGFFAGFATTAANRLSEWASREPDEPPLPLKKQIIKDMTPLAKGMVSNLKPLAESEILRLLHTRKKIR